MSIRRFFSLSLRHWHGAAPHQNGGSPRLNPLIVGFIIKTIVVAFLMVVVLAAGQNEATRRLSFSLRAELKPTKLKAIIAALPRTRRNHPPDGERPAVFLFHRVSPS